MASVRRWGNVAAHPRVWLATGFMREAMRTSARSIRAAEEEGGTSVRPRPRPSTISNLYDVFVNIAADESEHVTTMRSCQDSVDDLSSRSFDGSSASAARACAIDKDDAGFASWAVSAVDLLDLDRDPDGDDADRRGPGRLRAEEVD